MSDSCCRILKCFSATKAVWFIILCTICIAMPVGPQPQAYAPKHDYALSDDFPLYPVIKPNVEFWIDIFTIYSASQGVMHDSVRLDIVYDIVKLDTSATVRSNRKNKRTKEAVVKKYKTILLALATGKAPTSGQEKKVASLFGPSAKPSDFKSAASRIRCQTGLKEEFKKGLIRSGKVIDAFKKTFHAHGLPEDLIYMPCVESSYNFRAYSKFGAAGIWQFTRGTGRQYMKIDYVVDQRRDPYISTKAAARLLKKNYADLESWPLAITAYNHGLAGMRRAQKAKGSYENIFTSYSSRSFKFASRNFYSEFLAARIVAKNPEKYFGPIVVLEPETFIEVRTKGYLPVLEASRQLNVSVEEIKRLNPSLRTPVFNNQKYIPKGFGLRLPETFSPSKVSSQLAVAYHDRQKPSRFHSVQRGDTAGSIARQHRVKLSDLILANQLNRRATIYVGQNLRIPLEDEVILAKKTPPRAKKTEPRSAKEPVVKAPAVKVPMAKPASPKPVEPEIRVADVIAPEPAGPEVIEPEPAGSEAIEVKAVEAEAIDPEAKLTAAKQEPIVNPNIVTTHLQVLETIRKKDRLLAVIKVEPEETLGHYADWLGIPTQEIRTLNRLKYRTPIAMNQTIKIPLKNKSVQDFEELRYEFHKEIEEDFFESFSVQTMETYHVKKGDNIWSICLNTLEIPFWLVKKYNPKIDFSTLHPRQKIQYPVLSPKETS